MKRLKDFMKFYTPSVSKLSITHLLKPIKLYLKNKFREGEVEPSSYLTPLATDLMSRGDLRSITLCLSNDNTPCSHSSDTLKSYGHWVEIQHRTNRRSGNRSYIMALSRPNAAPHSIMTCITRRVAVKHSYGSGGAQWTVVASHRLDYQCVRAARYMYVRYTSIGHDKRYYRFF